MKKITRKFLALAMAFMLVFSILSGSIIAAAQDTGVSIYLDGQEIKPQVAPFIVNGATMVQAKALFDALGAALTWDAKTKTVTGTKDAITVVLVIGSKTAKVNGTEVAIDAPAMLKNGSTMVPLRFVCETFNLLVYYDEASRSVILAQDIDDVLDPPVDKLKSSPYVSIDTLGKSQLTDAEIKNLGKDAKTLRNSIKTVEDAAKVLRLNNLNHIYDRVTYVKGGGWVATRDPQTALNSGKCKPGDAAYMVKYLLDGDYDEVGFFYLLMGNNAQISNYIVEDGKTYLVDLSVNLECSCVLVSSLQDYADEYTMVKDNTVILSYDADHLLTSCLDIDKKTLYLPAGFDIKVLLTKGYKVNCSTVLQS